MGKDAILRKFSAIKKFRLKTRIFFKFWKRVVTRKNNSETRLEPAPLLAKSSFRVVRSFRGTPSIFSVFGILRKKSETCFEWHNLKISLDRQRPSRRRWQHFWSSWLTMKQRSPVQSPLTVRSFCMAKARLNFLIHIIKGLKKKEEN